MLWVLIWGLLWAFKRLFLIPINWHCCCWPSGFKTLMFFLILFYNKYLKNLFNFHEHISLDFHVKVRGLLKSFMLCSPLYYKEYGFLKFIPLLLFLRALCFVFFSLFEFLLVFDKIWKWQQYAFLSFDGIFLYKKIVLLAFIS